jgi:hypothetical protein
MLAVGAIGVLTWNRNVSMIQGNMYHLMQSNRPLSTLSWFEEYGLNCKGIDSKLHANYSVTRLSFSKENTKVLIFSGKIGQA